jgi:hypothetical protein
VGDRLLGSEQHGVRYGRHWLDVLRYADVDERMIAAPGMDIPVLSRTMRLVEKEEGRGPIRAILS